MGKKSKKRISSGGKSLLKLTFEIEDENLFVDQMKILANKWNKMEEESN